MSSTLTVVGSLYPALPYNGPGLAPQGDPGLGAACENGEKELFRAVVKFVRQKGITSRAEIIEEFYDEDDTHGYSSPESWHVRIIDSPFRELEDRTDAIERALGGIRYRSPDREELAAVA